MHVWYTYILECVNKDLYTGITDNLQRRFQEHKTGKGGKFTHALGYVAQGLLNALKKESGRDK